MDSRALSVLLGMLAGDSSIYSRDQYDKRNGKYYARITFSTTHGPQQRAYCEYKCALVNKLLWTTAKVNHIKHGPERRYDGYVFQFDDDRLKSVHKLVYPNGKKRFSQKWLDQLTPEGIALWYMDDGHAHSHPNSKGFISAVSTELATCCSRDEAELIREWFLNQYGIEMKLKPEKSNWSLRANTEHSRYFAKLVQPWICEPMLYKLRHVADLGSHECRAPIGQCPSCQRPVYRFVKGVCQPCYNAQWQRSIPEGGHPICPRCRRDKYRIVNGVCAPCNVSVKRGHSCRW